MALLTWSNRYSVGVKAMDEQHIKLIAIMNELHAAMMKGEAQSVTAPLLKRMTDYMRGHFASEEAMLETAKFPDLARHRDQHRALDVKLKEFISRHEMADNTLYVPLIYFCRDWIKNHMLMEDKGFTKWMNEHGVH